MMTNENFVTWRKNSDREILQASQEARNTFRDFWYQVALDFNRIVPALQIASLKVTFSDDFSDPDSQLEHMWVNQIDFDGISIYGVLVNSPNFLKSVKEGDEVSFPLDCVSDWLCVLNGEVYGGYTIQVIRNRMSGSERKEHDEAWGLPFPSPDTVLVPERNQKFAKAIADMMAEQVKKQPEVIGMTYDEGRTLLHLESLYGKADSVKVLLEYGASSEAKCDRGWTPLDYAKVLNWGEIIELLAKN